MPKQTLLIEQLSRPEGAKIDELTKVLGWLPHALTGLRRKGVVNARENRQRRVGLPVNATYGSEGRRPAVGREADALRRSARHGDRMQNGAQSPDCLEPRLLDAAHIMADVHGELG